MDTDHLMRAFNLTSSMPSAFILTGIPGLEVAHIWISIPFAMFYIISLLGNFMILFVVSKEQTLHKPMYLLLCMLALSGIVISTCVIPKTLCILWFSFKDITLQGCLTQIFFYNAFGAMQSAVLVTMAFDRYIVICDPLRYTAIITNEQISLLGLLGLMRAFLLVTPLPLLLQRLKFCDNHVIPHTYCEHITVLKMSCSDTSINRMYSLMATILTIGLDLTLIGLSYGLILMAILKISTQKTHQKAVNSCTTHICVMLITYSSVLFSVLTQRFGQGIPAHVHILLANIYQLAGPVFNPIIYGVKSKEIREKITKYTCRM